MGAQTLGKRGGNREPDNRLKKGRFMNCACVVTEEKAIPPRDGYEYNGLVLVQPTRFVQNLLPAPYWSPLPLEPVW